MATQPLPLEQDDGAQGPIVTEDTALYERLNDLWKGFVESLWVLRVYGMPTFYLTLLLTVFIITAKLGAGALEGFTDDLIHDSTVILAQQAERNPRLAPMASDMSARQVVALVQEAMLRGYDFNSMPFNHDYDFKVARLGTQLRSDWFLSADHQFVRDASMMPDLDNIMTGVEPGAGSFRNQQVEMAIDYDGAMQSILNDVDFAAAHPDLHEEALQLAPGWNAFMARGELTGWVMVARATARWFDLTGNSQDAELAGALSLSADVMADAMLQDAAGTCMDEASRFQQLLLTALQRDGAASIPGSRAGEFVMGVPPELMLFTNIERYAEAMDTQTNAARERASHIVDLAQAWCEGVYRVYKPA
ncbi:hypothetical protein GC177_08175 [bacterium]|nr:hypothetical protein [bacterium]